MSDKELMELASEARGLSYCQYSHFSVGAALLAEDGCVFTGANIESAAFSPSVCAERAALLSAVKAGKRRFSAIAISGGREGCVQDKLVSPCGVCRQSLSEFDDGSLKVIMTDGEKLISMTLSELLPFAFRDDSM